MRALPWLLAVCLLVWVGEARADEAGRARVEASRAASPDEERAPLPCSEPRDVEQVYPRVDLNHADEAALIGLPGIGEARARAILAYRSAHGGFRSLSQLLQVKGIGRALLKRLRPLVTL